MLYKKPRDLKYTDMCIWIDEHAYDQDVDEEQLFIYLYHIVVMLARTQNFFRRSEYYDDFGVYLATILFLRYKNEKQFQLDENGQPLLPRIKGVLNYTRRVSYPYKVQFEQQEYAQVYSKQPEEDDNVQLSEYLFSDVVADSIDSLSSIEFDVCLGDIISTAKHFLSKIPYATNKKEWTNIYISCMLSFLNSITMTNKSIKRLQSLQNPTEYKYNKTIQKDGEDYVILFHLPDSYHNYIHVLTKELKHALPKDLSFSLHTYIPAESGMRQLVVNELAGISGDGDY